MNGWSDKENPEEKAKRQIVTIIQNLLRKHFPEAQIEHFPPAEGVDQIEGVRFFAPDHTVDPPRPTYISAGFSVSPEKMRVSAYDKHSGQISEAERNREALMDDVWKIFEGYGADCTLEPAAAGVKDIRALERPLVSLSSDVRHAATAGGIGLYGDPVELVARISDNISYNPELSYLVPNSLRPGKSR